MEMIRLIIINLWQCAEWLIIRLFNDFQNAHYRQKKSVPVNDNLLSLGKVSCEYHPNQREDIYLDIATRLRHVYILGATGCGKSNLMESFLRQDVRSGNGFCLIDCHGDLANSLTSYIALQRSDESAAKTIIIEPFNKEWFVGFNPLEVRANESAYPKAIEIMGIFQKIWGADIFGPRTAELFRNTLLTLMDNGLTLLEAQDLLCDDYFRNSLLDKITSPEVKGYWLDRYNPLSDNMKAMYRDAVINKLTVFTSDPQVRLMLGSKQSGLDFENAMNEGKWIILNLAKGHLKENMNLLATLFISTLAGCAFNRINIPSHQRRPFFIYIDEFQNFCNSSDLLTLLSEARKYAVGTVIAHQHSKQISSDILKAILGNAQTQVYFRLSYQDSQFFATEINPYQKERVAKILADLPIGKAYLKVKGMSPSLLSTTLCHSINISKGMVEDFKELIFQTHGEPVMEPAPIQQQETEQNNMEGQDEW